MNEYFKQRMAQLKAAGGITPSQSVNNSEDEREKEEEVCFVLQLGRVHFKPSPWLAYSGIDRYVKIHVAKS